MIVWYFERARFLSGVLEHKIVYELFSGIMASCKVAVTINRLEGRHMAVITARLQSAHAVHSVSLLQKFHGQDFGAH